MTFIRNVIVTGLVIYLLGFFSHIIATIFMIGWKSWQLL